MNCLYCGSDDHDKPESCPRVKKIEYGERITSIEFHQPLGLCVELENEETLMNISGEVKEVKDYIKKMKKESIQ